MVVIADCISTTPEPFADTSKFALEAFVVILLSLILTKSTSALPVTVCAPVVLMSPVVNTPVTPNVVDTVAAPVTASVEPSNVKLASPCIPPAPVTVVIVLLVDPDNVAFVSAYALSDSAR